MTDPAAAAAIGAATRELRLPVVRSDAGRLTEVAQRTQQSYLGFLAEVLSAGSTSGSSGAASGGSTKPTFLAPNASPTST